MKKKALFVSLALGLILSAGAVYCASLLLRLIEPAVSLIGIEGNVAAILMQLSRAAVRINWWIAAPGALLTSLPIYRLCVTRRKWLKFLCVLGILVFLLAIWLAAVLTMHVNSIPVGTALRILIKWILGGVLNEL